MTPLTWSKEKPTVPGWSWWKRPNYAPRLGQTDDVGGELFFMFMNDDPDQMPYPVTTMYPDTEWAGPLVRPEEG